MMVIHMQTADVVHLIFHFRQKQDITLHIKSAKCPDIQLLASKESLNWTENLKGANYHYAACQIQGNTNHELMDSVFEHLVVKTAWS